MKSKTVKVVLDGYGSFLGRDRGCFVIRDKQGQEKRFPLFESEIGEIQVKTGNLVSSGALVSAAFWQIPVLFQTQRGNPVGILKSLEDDSHVKTRVAQYQATQNGKLLEIAKTLVLAKIEGQNQVLKKYGLRMHDYSPIEQVKREDRLTALKGIEGRASNKYFRNIFGLIEESLRPERRRTFKAFDAINNLFNLAYTTLSWKVHVALLNAKLEPFLGFLHSLAWGKPSLVCDFQELYRYLMDDFVIQYCKEVRTKDLILKEENFSSNKKGKRQYINDIKTRDLMRRIDAYFLTKVSIPRIRMGERQEIETLISEEALLLARYLRDEKPTWNPRIVALS
jgi:CRISPR-associated protein Cas1